MTDVQRIRRAITRFQECRAGVLGLTAVAQRPARRSPYRQMCAGKAFALEEARFVVQGSAGRIARGLTRRPADDLWCVA